MDAFVSRKRKQVAEPPQQVATSSNAPPKEHPGDDEDESTDFKLALLASLHPALNQATLLEALLVSNGSVQQASTHLINASTTPPRKRLASSTVGYQSSLSAYRLQSADGKAAKRPLVKKGQTLYLYSPEDIEANTPCSIIHNFLPAKQADALLLELLDEAPTYQSLEFKLFDRIVWAPHTFCCKLSLQPILSGTIFPIAAIYVNSLAEAEEQRTEYMYNGRKEVDVRQSTPQMLQACPQVEQAVNREVHRRIQAFYPNGTKLKYQSPHPWKANTAFVNCYDGPRQNVGYHSDQLTYLGPRAIIGSLSLGVTRDFRVRKTVAEDDETLSKANGTLADAQGQISIQVPHNSLLVMHAEMQEEWKHCIAPAQAIDPHPLAGNKRLNITYRYYKDSLHPQYTPKCRCGVPTVLRCATRKKESRGRYMWMCHTHYIPGQDGCGFFQWAEFDEDGEPPWGQGVNREREDDLKSGMLTALNES